ncbi:hypothetical protein ABZ464_12160 [Streptomyces sp. NPDC005820]|uniref:hypothetical protein n=1 Tax=Streptomyces sp. NPDC005820 TaxID=3157069 RepID=UPI0033D83FF4
MIETSPSSVDVVPPCLDEAGALPWVLHRIPPGRRAIEPKRGFGAACHAGLTAAAATATADVVGFCDCDCDASPDPGPLPAGARSRLDGTADLVLGRRRPTARGARPVHARLADLEPARLTWRAVRDMRAVLAERPADAPAPGPQVTGGAL